MRKPMTPLVYSPMASRKLGVNVYLKRDDLYPISGGGNKGRKAEYILSKCLSDGCNAVVTCGGLQSNHVRATAIKCRELGIECTIVIHSSPVSRSTGNLKLLELLGVNVVYCEMSDVSDVMDREMDRFKSNGLTPFYIWGGGHSYEGTLAFFDAVKEVECQSDVDFDSVFVASGTGATQAGLHCGFKSFFPKTKVYGISVAREQARGTEAVRQSVEEFIEKYGLDKTYSNDIFFTDRYHFGGYENSSELLTSKVIEVARSTGIVLDPTYTGKAWFGMEDMIKSGNYTSQSNVLFWHTGGLLNLMAC
ncbi:pyridoxal-phosphate dependent enzyme [Pseudoalteromonas rubra]|uniref:Pyridoxal-phosphate dependent enzyme n=2 Tax=Pseudoalteromonas TaxID=53246 RepID=A0A5S3V1U5_9GAMM|nr:pyridoxal-phosphate dependent enzyme [Pseudoalteromonas rubra]QPB84644.1 pyridoxal-phosphate dependent enzyme [Pseudoalteromonas rubra]